MLESELGCYLKRRARIEHIYSLLPPTDGVDDDDSSDDQMIRSAVSGGRCQVSLYLHSEIIAVTTVEILLKIKK